MREPEAQPFWDSLEAIKRSYECQSVKVDSFRIYIYIYIFYIIYYMSYIYVIYIIFIFIDNIIII